ncbi:MAG: hypothetical protein LUQ26_08465 [Methylococcaceae bacterium]|jgi:YtfJ family uncharacterized protein|nr:hypothetical protein [Methylococcaceae bacterium]
MRIILFWIISFITEISYSADILEGHTLTEVKIQGKPQKSGELRQSGNKIKYIDWNLSEYTGKALTILHLSARPATENSIKTLIDALRNSNDKFDKTKYTTINILNTDDIPFDFIGKFFGESRAVDKYEEDFIKQRTQSVFVVDDDSKAKKSWHLKENGNAIILLNKNKEVVFFKDAKEGEILLDNDKSEKYINKTLEIIGE